MCSGLVRPKLDCWAALISELQPLDQLWAGFLQYRCVLLKWGPEVGGRPGWGELAGDPPCCLLLPTWPILLPLDFCTLGLCLLLPCSALILPEGHTQNQRCMQCPRRAKQRTGSVLVLAPSSLPRAACLLLPAWWECPRKREYPACSYFLTHVDDALTHFYILVNQIMCNFFLEQKCKQ